MCRQRPQVQDPKTLESHLLTPIDACWYLLLLLLLLLLLSLLLLLLLLTLLLLYNRIVPNNATVFEGQQLFCSVIFSSPRMHISIVPNSLREIRATIRAAI